MVGETDNCREWTQKAPLAIAGTTRAGPYPRDTRLVLANIGDKASRCE